jgi:hypothetical protein
VSQEWRPTFLEGNVGTIVPQILSGYEPAERLVFDARVAYTSLVFENTRLRNVTIKNGTFVRTSFVNVDWKDVCFKNCHMTEVVLDKQCRYDDVVFDDCKIQGVRVLDETEEYREYSPLRVAQVLGGLGIRITEVGQQTEIEFAPATESDFHKLVRRFLRVFRRITGLTEHVIEIRYRADQRQIHEEILPLLERYAIVRNEQRHGGGPPQSRWLLQTTLEDLLRADGGPGAENLVKFWKEVADHK